MSSSSTSYLPDWIRNKLENEDHKGGPISDDDKLNETTRGAKDVEVEVEDKEDDNKLNDKVEVEIVVEENEEEEGCGRCMLEEIMESSVCGKEIKARRKCMNAAETEQDLEKCVELHKNMIKCIEDNNENYYKAIFEAIFKDANNNQEQSSNNNVQSPAAEQEDITPPN